MLTASWPSAVNMFIKPRRAPSLWTGPFLGSDLAFSWFAKLPKAFWNQCFSKSVSQNDWTGIWKRESFTEPFVSTWKWHILWVLQIQKGILMHGTGALLFPVSSLVPHIMYDETFTLIWLTLDKMVWHGILFVLHLYRTWNKSLEQVGRHCMEGFVGAKTLRTPLTVDAERCNIWQENLGLSFVSTLWKQHGEHCRTLCKPKKWFSQIFKIGYTVTLFFNYRLITLLVLLVVIVRTWEHLSQLMLKGAIHDGRNLGPLLYPVP